MWVLHFPKQGLSQWGKLPTQPPPQTVPLALLQHLGVWAMDPRERSGPFLAAGGMVLLHQPASRAANHGDVSGDRGNIESLP